MLGALLARLPVLPLEALEDALRNHLPERHKKLLPMNLEALHKGAAFARGEVEKLSAINLPPSTPAPEATGVDV
jgi:Pyruvate/2-oxoacid:ferredoxin oxidoreductase gamma subunit